MLVCFSYSGARVFTKKSSNGLMNELSWTTDIDFGAAAARRGPRAAAAPPASVTVRNSRRVLMRPPPRRGGQVGEGSLRRRHSGKRARVNRGAGTGPIETRRPPHPCLRKTSASQRVRHCRLRRPSLSRSRRRFLTRLTAGATVGVPGRPGCRRVALYRPDRRTLDARSTAPHAAHRPGGGRSYFAGRRLPAHTGLALGLVVGHRTLPLPDDDPRGVRDPRRLPDHRLAQPAGPSEP